MEELFELIFSNPLFIILIVGGLISLLKGGADNKNKQQTEQQRPRQPQTVTRSPNQQQAKAKQQSSQAKPQSQPKERVVRSTSIELQRQKQLDQLTNRFGVDTEDDEHSASKAEEHSKLKVRQRKLAEQRRKAETAALHGTETQRRLKRRFQKKLTRDGLIDSVIMSEVLGSPRARKPYESVVKQRRRS